MTWNASTLGEIAERDGGLIQTGPFGSQLHQSDYVADGIPVIMPKDITDGRVDATSVARVSEATANRLSRHQLRPRTIVLPRRGEITKRAFIRDDQAGWLCGTGCLQIVLEGKHLLPEFLYYYMEQEAIGRWLEQHAVGTTMLNLSAGIVSGLPLKYPMPVTQQRIADILSAYDNLIENNRRRMALVEDAGRQLYREWFVCLRFPGHEHTRITNGVPDGWEQRELEQCVSVLETGNRPDGGVSGISEGVPSIGAESIVGVGQFDFSKTKYVPEDYFSRLRKGAIEDRDVLVYKDGGRPGHFTPHVSMFGGGFPFDRMALNSHVYRVRGAYPISQEFLYYHLSSEPMLGWMNSAGTGAAIPGIARRDLLRLPLLVASNRLLEGFTEVASTGITQVLKLALMNRKLHEARDLLLPRLMSGEVAV